MSDHEAARPERVVGIKQGQVPWARTTIEVLREIATTYNATITQGDLAEEVQQRTRLRTDAQLRTWISNVLTVVVMACHERDLPPLTSLVVRKQDGRVGNGYDDVLRVTGERPITDELEREWHAAAARLACYREYSDDLPDDAEPTLGVAAAKAPGDRRRTSAGGTRAPAGTRSSGGAAATSKRVPPREPAPVALCPTCFIQLPVAGGACPNCD